LSSLPPPCCISLPLSSPGKFCLEAYRLLCKAFVFFFPPSTGWSISCSHLLFSYYRVSVFSLPFFPECCTWTFPVVPFNSSTNGNPICLFHNLFPPTHTPPPLLVSSPLSFCLGGRLPLTPLFDGSTTVGFPFEAFHVSSFKVGGNHHPFVCCLTRVPWTVP